MYIFIYIYIYIYLYYLPVALQQLRPPPPPPPCVSKDEGLEELAINGIIRNRMLLQLSLRLNQFSGGAGALNMLLRAVKRHPRLAHLDLGRNIMRPECIPELIELLEKSVCLLCLHLLGSEASYAQDNVKIQAACYRWTAETSGVGLRTDSDGNVLVPEPAPGDEYSELILGRAPHQDHKDWLVATPLPKPMEVPASLDGIRDSVRPSRASSLILSSLLGMQEEHSFQRVLNPKP